MYVPGESGGLFDTGGSFASKTVWAAVVYSLVPYLGIIFVPAALVISAVSIFSSRRARRFADARTAGYAAIAAGGIFAVQLLLWALLYYVASNAQ